MKTTLKIFMAIALIFCFIHASAQHTVTKLWETEQSLPIPESVFFDGKVLYVSLIDGSPWDKDGKGGLAKLTTQGKFIDTAWITGLNSPKGMCKYGNILYVADMDEVVLVDIKKGVVTKKLTIDGAGGLNDITVDNKGVVYVTDSKYGKVFKIEGKESKLYLQDLKGINGIISVNINLYILTGDAMLKADAAKTLTKVCTLENGGDGIEPVGNGDFLVTAWAGYLYYVHADGQKDLLLDTHNTNSKTADIGYDAKNRIIYVPTFMANSVAAYKLK